MALTAEKCQGPLPKSAFGVLIDRVVQGGQQLPGIVGLAQDYMHTKRLQFCMLAFRGVSRGCDNIHLRINLF